MTKCQGHKGHKLSLAKYFNIKEDSCNRKKTNQD